MKHIKGILDSSLKHIASRPSEGVFYLVPKPDGTQEFYYDRTDEPFTDEFDAMLHFSFWGNVVHNVLAQAWKINPDSIKELYACIPRGRVDKIDMNTYAVIHGGDSIVSPFQRAMRAFGLSELWAASKGEAVREIIDSAHEVVDPRQVAVFEKLIGRSLEDL